MNPNLSAFLAAVRSSEGTDRAADPYRVVFGYSVTLQNLAGHPADTGEWMGAHYTLNGKTVLTTAAGAYQIIHPTWTNLKARLSLPDFTGPSQDAAAAELIREVGALDLIVAGNLGRAVDLCHNLWASLPSSTAGQPTVTLAALTDAYTAAGGTLA